MFAWGGLQGGSQSNQKKKIDVVPETHTKSWLDCVQLTPPLKQNRGEKVCVEWL